MTKDDAELRALLRREGERYVSDSDALRRRLEVAMTAENSHRHGPDATLIELKVNRLRARPHRGQGSQQPGSPRWVGAGLSAAAAAAVVAVAAGTFSLWAPRTRQTEPSTIGPLRTAASSVAPIKSWVVLRISVT